MDKPSSVCFCSNKYSMYNESPSSHLLDDKVGANVVGTAVGGVGATLGNAVGVEIGACVGVAVGTSVGLAVGMSVGTAVSAPVGTVVGTAVVVATVGVVGTWVGTAVGAADGNVEGARETPALLVPFAFAPSVDATAVPKTTPQPTPTISATTQRPTNAFRAKMPPPRFGFVSSEKFGMYPILATSSGPSPTSE
jgi:hypothetical protein